MLEAEAQISESVARAGEERRGCHSWETTGESYGSRSSRTLFGAHHYPILKLYPRIKLEHRKTP